MKKVGLIALLFIGANSQYFGQDTTPPVITCPSNITASNTVGQCGAIVNFSASAVDDSQVLSANLLLNGGAELNSTANWTVTNGGDGWAITTDAHTGTYSFIGSYGMGTMTQLLDLVALGYSTSLLDAIPEVNVSEWYKASGCCSVEDNYFYRAELLNQSMTVIASFNLGAESATVPSTSVWQQVQHTFTAYPVGMRYIRIVHGSSDDEFWAGQYGTVIDDSEVTMMVNEAVLSYSQNPGTLFPVGTTTVTATASDVAGNSSTCVFDIIVNDTQIPTVPVLNTITGECSVTNVPTPVATDNCAGQVTATTATSMVFDQQGSYLIVWQYNDGNGNTTTQNQAVNVNDVNGPIPDLANLPDLIGACSVSMPTAPTATDNCTGPATGTTTTQFPITAVGTTVVTWTYVDGHNKTSTQTQNVIITGVDVSTYSNGNVITAANSSATNYQWIDCLDNSIIGGATNQSFTATNNGQYAVIVTQSGCSDTSACITIAGIGMNELTLSDVSIYPNPSMDGRFVIESTTPFLNLELIDNSGRSVAKVENSLGNSYDFSHLENGNYFVKLIYESGFVTQKIVLQK